MVNIQSHQSNPTRNYQTTLLLSQFRNYEACGKCYSQLAGVVAPVFCLISEKNEMFSLIVEVVDVLFSIGKQVYSALIATTTPNTLKIHLERKLWSTRSWPRSSACC